MSALAVVTGSEDRAVADLDLVAGVRAGDERAFEQLFLRYQPRIAAYVCGMVRDHARAEDITQEIFLAALRRLQDGTDREIQFRPWIYEIAKNKCIDAYRRGRHGIEVSFDAYEAVGADDHSRLAGPRPTPDDAMEDKLALDSLCGAFGSLSQVHHDILVMREFEGLSYREIGDRLGLSRPAVESTLFRARKRLSEEYEQLVSGERCRLVQRTVDAAGIRRRGLREQRRIARHLAHCQPCRRYARLAGVDLADPGQAGRARTAAARIAAFLPLPAFLKRRWDGGDATAQLLAAPGARPVAQWSAQVAGSFDPGAVTGWTKAFATAATVAVAGVGAGSAILDRAGVPAQGVFGSPIVREAAHPPPQVHSLGISSARQTSGRPAATPAAVAPPATGVGRRAPATGPAANGAARGPTASGPALPDTPAGGPLSTATGGAASGLRDAVRGRGGRSGNAGGDGRNAGVVLDEPPARAGPLLSDGVTGLLSGGLQASEPPLQAATASEPAGTPAAAPEPAQSTAAQTPAAGGSGPPAGGPTSTIAGVPSAVPPKIHSTTPALGLAR